MDYYLSREDKEDFIALASCEMAKLRDLWRKYVVSGLIEPFEFWNGFIKYDTFYKPLNKGKVENYLKLDPELRVS